ncbi:MAG TPA: gliding motility-associated C-terminal domain-containing protein [Puia sp.]|nr:gliding motility-associated C-terminal domain-containing protein [Puia sp.]
MKYVVINFLLVIGYFTNAQTCSGGLGDPIVNITFGAGSNFGPALAPGITDLEYVPKSCPADGQYTIASGVMDCYHGGWFDISGDHTGDSLGYFMLINASYDPSDFYVQTVTGLCEGTRYQFAAWVLNMLASQGEILPNITFTIEKPDGTVLSSESDVIPDATPPAWKQYGFFFTTPPGVTSVIMRMSNNAPGGVGNDLALDDITFRPVGPAVALQVTAHSANTVPVCVDDPGALSFTSTVESCYAATEYQWQRSTDLGLTWTDIPGAAGSTYNRLPTPAGTYLYRLMAAQAGYLGATCSVVSEPITVVVNEIPVPAVAITSTVTRLCADSSADFTAVPGNGGDEPVYQWMLNGAEVGTNSPFYTNNSWTEGDVVSCRLTSNAFCVVDPTVTSNTIAMTVYPLPVIRLIPDTTIAAGSSIRLTPIITGDIVTYLWTPPAGLDDVSLQEPLASPVASTTYTLQVVSEDGCRASAKEMVNVFYDLFMPGGFSPNGDGNNDVFRVPPSVPVTVLHFYVYNRWGEQVFATNSSNGGWNGNLNGKPQPAGVYVWQIEYFDLIRKKAVVRTGTVVLVR